MALHQGHTPVVNATAAPCRRRRWAWIVFVGVALAVVAFVRVTITDPRVHVRWHESIGAAERAALERQYDLRNGTLIEGTSTTWRYELGDPSRETIRALLDHPSVDDTAYIDRDALTSEGRAIAVEIRNPLGNPLEPSQLIQLSRSVWILFGGGLLLWSAGASSSARRRNIAVATLLL